MFEPDSWPDQPLVEPLTPREMDVLSRLAENRTNQQIADELVLSLHTVKWYARWEQQPESWRILCQNTTTRDGGP